MTKGRFLTCRWSDRRSLHPHPNRILYTAKAIFDAQVIIRDVSSNPLPASQSLAQPAMTDDVSAT
jgi:hypothetical protein